MFCHACDLEIKHSLYDCPFCGGTLSEEPKPLVQIPVTVGEPAAVTQPASVNSAIRTVKNEINPEPAIKQVQTSAAGENMVIEQIYDNEIITFISNGDTGAVAPNDIEPSKQVTAFISYSAPETLAESEQSDERGFSFFKILVPAGVAAAVLLAVFLVLNFFNSGFSQSVSALYDDISIRTGSSVLAVAPPLSKCLKDGEIKAELSYTDEYSDTVSCSLGYASNTETALHRLSLEADIYGNPVNAVLLIDNDYAALGSSMLGDSYFGIRFDSFAEDFKTFTKTNGLSDLDIKDYEQIVRAIDYTFNRNLSLPESTSLKLSEIFSDFFESLPRTKSRERVVLGGENVTATVLTCSVTSENFSDFGERLLQFVSSDEYLRGLPSAYIQPSDSLSYREGVEPVDYCLDQLEYALDMFSENCRGDMSIRLISAKGRLCMIELFTALYFNDTPLRLGLTFDFGQSVHDDWILDCYAKTALSSYTLNMIWSFDDSGANAVNEMKFILSDGHSIETASLFSQWNQNTGLFSVSLKEASNRFNINLRGTLNYSDGGFDLSLNTTPELSFQIRGSADCSIAQVPFINIDKWDNQTLKLFEYAVLELYSKIYSYPVLLPEQQDDTLIQKR